MAKKEKKFEISRLGSILDKISKQVPILIEKEVKPKTFITTGVYLLDAAISARLLGGGVANNRITAFAGESGTGKSFLAYSCARYAQREGYTILYIDTETAIDLEDLPKHGIDISPDKFTLVRSNKVEDINITLTQLIDELKEAKMAGEELPKIMFVLDSLGQMASNKEKEDLLKGDIKQDMTKAKALGSLFRSINTDIGYLEIPMIVCNHTYQTLDMFSQEKLKGGNGLLYSASVIGFMSKSKLKDGTEDDMDLGQSGINVLFKTTKNRMAKPKKIRFDISFAKGMNRFSGLEAFCREEYFEQIGIAKGKMEVDKATGEEVFIPGGNRWYVRHLGKTVTTKQLHNSTVFTREVLEAMEPIVNSYFAFNDFSDDELVDDLEEFTKMDNVVDVDENGFADLDADDIF